MTWFLAKIIKIIKSQVFFHLTVHNYIWFTRYKHEKCWICCIIDLFLHFYAWISIFWKKITYSLKKPQPAQKLVKLFGTIFPYGMMSFLYMGKIVPINLTNFWAGCGFFNGKVIIFRKWQICRISLPVHQSNSDQKRDPP